jgi:hypothetical protein
VVFCVAASNNVLTIQFFSYLFSAAESNTAHEKI